ncbi:Superoxide dismutase [Cu-Zn] [Mactra antiquata]
MMFYCRFLFCVWIVLCLELLFYVRCQDMPPLPEFRVVPRRRPPPCDLEDLYAKCTLVANPNIPSDINGTIYFMQKVMRSNCEYGFMSIQVKVHNVPTNDETDNHGFHIHEYGDMLGGCESMGGHYNPYNATHGSLWHPVGKRHLGDLGNVRQRPNGDINMRIRDFYTVLFGKDTIIGRGVVLHAQEDDLGMNEDKGSKTTGNAGPRLACGVIGHSGKFDEKVFTLYK